MRRYVETLLERSGNARLTVTLDWPELYSSTLDMSVDEDTVASIFDALRVNSNRIRVFNFIVSAHIDNETILRKLKTSYSSLEHLNFSFHYGGLVEELEEIDLDFFSDVSALHSLSYQCHTGWKVRSHFPWHQLNRLVMQDVNAGEFLPILTGCNNLRELELSDVNANLEEEVDAEHHILVPNLQLLGISTSDDDDLSSIIQHLTVPKLQSIKIRGLWNSSGSDPEDKFWTLASVRSLLTRSRCPVGSLELQWVVLLHHDTVALLDLMPGLRSIKIVEAYGLDQPIEDRQNYIVTPSFLRRLSSEPRTCGTSSSSFLPKLKNLTLFVHQNDLDETSLVHAIASRWGGRGHMSNTTSGTDEPYSEFLQSVEIRLLTFDEGPGSLGGLPMLECFKDAGLRVTLGNCTWYHLLRRVIGRSLLD
ncbi:hypothetical protein AAF712_000295 [Marasmius tenuissimus]|uniref:Uncharacterized protein n=1 Tax=Marasmius tenuissimus TaxID=585030 RepID=A0ABR3AGM8_9AGAR